MATIRVEHDKDNPYVIMNKDFLKDKNLTLEAKGLLSYLLSLPSDWQIYESELANSLEYNRKTIGFILYSLHVAGYCTRSRNRNEYGQVTDYNYTVFESSSEDELQYDNPPKNVPSKYLRIKSRESRDLRVKSSRRQSQGQEKDALLSNNTILSNNYKEYYGQAQKLPKKTKSSRKISDLSRIILERFANEFESRNRIKYIPNPASWNVLHNTDNDLLEQVLKQDDVLINKGLKGVFERWLDRTNDEFVAKSDRGLAVMFEPSVFAKFWSQEIPFKVSTI